ncbi:unnamed protein product [Mytilus edulis]|uniref:Uncharacterized protein n=1 Tax=Mytilus edulis TaxID=6550 RepID=A0A8S3S1U0_MYTED|nr:unnamed protein product [Mytilus edulis]
MEQRAKNEVTHIQSIYEEELVKLRTPEWNDDTKQFVEQLPTYYSCKTSLYHQRALDRPVIPKTIIDIDLQDEWCLTTTRQQFLLPSDNIYPPILIFSTTNSLTHLAAANTIFCDGTFYSCPTLFHQLYTVHAMIDGSMFPLVHALLPGKDQFIYSRFFSHIRDLVQQHQYGLYGQPFDSDLFDSELPISLKQTAPSSSYASAVSSTMTGVVNNSNTNSGGSNIEEIDFYDLFYPPSDKSSKVQLEYAKNNVFGMLEVEPLHFTCHATSDGTKMEKMDQQGISSIANNTSSLGGTINFGEWNPHLQLQHQQQQTFHPYHPRWLSQNNIYKN